MHSFSELEANMTSEDICAESSKSEGTCYLNVKFKYEGTY